MTIRLLSTYDGFAPNSIITIDPALEASFIAAGNATANLTGGVVAYRERQPVMIQPAVKKRGSVSLIANRKATVPLTEGSALTITPTAGTTGTYQRYDASGAAVGAAVAIGSAVLTVGPFEGDYTVEIKCTTGSLVAKTADAAGNTPVMSASGLLARNPQSGMVVSLPYARSRKGAVLLDFSDTANWASISGGVTRTADAAMAKRSSAAIKLVFGAGASTDGIKKTFGSPFYVQSGSNLKLVVYIDEPTFGNYSAIVKFSSDAAATKSLAYTLTNFYFRPGWNVIPLRAGEDGTFEPQNGATWASVGGQAWGDAFNYFEISFTGFASKTCWVDSLVVGSKSVPFWSFSTDGIDPSILNVIAPAFAANGWVATAFIDGDTGTINSFKATLLTLINTYGWEVGTQGLTHTDYSTNGRDIGADWDTCVANFLAAGLPAPRTFAYPLNSSNRANDAVLAAKGVVWRRAGATPLLHNVGFGCPNVPDGMVRQGQDAHLGLNYNQGPAHKQLVNRIAAMKFSGGIEHIFTHTEKFGTPDNIGGDGTHFYQWCESMKASEYSDGFQNILASQTKAALDAEIFK